LCSVHKKAVDWIECNVRNWRWLRRNMEVARQIS
jgi:hypothetical protein